MPESPVEFPTAIQAVEKSPTNPAFRYYPGFPGSLANRRDFPSLNTKPALLIRAPIPAENKIDPQYRVRDSMKSVHCPMEHLHRKAKENFVYRGYPDYLRNDYPEALQPLEKTRA